MTGQNRLTGGCVNEVDSESPLVSREIKDKLIARRSLYNPLELQDNVNGAILRLVQRLAQKHRLDDGGTVTFSN